VDALTQLANRRYLDAKLATYLEELRRYSWDFGLLLFDIDRFKRINDQYGHDYGDEILRSVGQTLSNAARTIDVVGRWGGEEFVGLYRVIDRDKLLRMAERFRGLIASISVPFDEVRICPTVSIGATIARPDDSPEALFKRADEALYEAKGSGRNRIRVK